MVAEAGGIHRLVELLCKERMFDHKVAIMDAISQILSFGGEHAKVTIVVHVSANMLLYADGDRYWVVWDDCRVHEKS